jgi:hypothetical protein
VRVAGGVVTDLKRACFGPLHSTHPSG